MPAEQKDNSVAELSSCDRYTVSKVKVSGEFSIKCDAGFVNATVIEGSGSVFDKEVKKGNHMLITSEGAQCIRLSGNMELIISYI